MNHSGHISKYHRAGRACGVLISVVVALISVSPAFAFAQDDSIGKAGLTITESRPLDTNGLLSVDSITVPAGSVSDISYPMSTERRDKLTAYSRFRNIWRFISFFVGVGVLLIILVTGFSARFRNWAAIGRQKFFVTWLYFILFLAATYILSFPFDVYRGFIVETDYGFSNQTFMQWWGEDLLGLLITAVIGVIPVWFLYWLMHKTKRWWLLFTAGSLPFIVFVVVLVPVYIAPLFNEFTPLKKGKLRTEILTLASNAGIEGSDVFEVNASRQSSKLNAYVTGLFNTKRIVLYDTMIKNFTMDEIQFVMGHEIGHYVMHHVWYGVGMAVFFVGLALWITNRTIHRLIRRFRRRFGFERLDDLASLPLVMVYATVLNFIFQPAINGPSRFMEHQADVYGMEITDVSGETAATAFDKFSVFNLSDPVPHPVIEFWFYSHPSLKKRMEFVRSYRK